MMIWLKRCGLFALSFVLSLTGLFSVFSADVSAASAFDTNYQTTDKLEVHDSWRASSRDITDIWTNIILAPDSVEDNVRYFAPNLITDEQELEGYRNYLRNMENWTISAAFGESPTSGGGNYPNGVVYVNLSVTENMSLEWIGSQVKVNGTQLALTISHDERYGFDVHFMSGYNVISNSSGSVKNYVAYVENQNIPENYGGDLPRSEIKELKDLTPEVYVRVDGLNISGYICYKDIPLSDDDAFDESICKTAKLLWGANTIVNWELKVEPDSLPLSEKKGLPFHKSSTFKTKVDNFGTYYLMVYYQAPPPPYASAESLGYRLHTLNLPIKVDGTTYSTGSSLQDCNNGVCEEYSEYRECSLNHTGLDIPALFGELASFLECQAYNFGVTLKNILNFLFIPNPNTLQGYFNSMIDRLKITLGFLYAPFDLIVKLFGLVSGQVVNPTGTTCSLGQLTMFGSTTEVHLCAWRYQFPQLWQLMQTAIQGGIALGLIYAFWRKFTSLFGAPVEDDTPHEMTAEMQHDSVPNEMIIRDDRKGVSMRMSDYRRINGGKK